MHPSAINPTIRSASWLLATAKFTLQFANSARELSWPRNWARSWPLHSPELTPCDFCLWGVKKSKSKTNPHTLEELSNDIRREIATIFRQELHRVTNNSSRSCFSAFGQEDNIFTICCGTDKCLLDLLLSAQRIVISLPSPTVKPTETRNMT
jgi:hypothetical protein